jgi:protein phosphatase
MVEPSNVDTEGKARPVSVAASGLALSLPLTVGVDFGVLTHVGKVRKNNEDHHLVARLGRIFEPLETNVPADAFPPYLGELGYALVVADGMGGAAAGEVASRMAISLFINLVIETGKWGRRIDEREARAVMERITNYYTAIHTKLTEQAEAEPTLSGMGTTFTMVYNLSSDLFVGHVGDSRAYLFREERLHRLTRDHTLAQQLADRGDIPLETVAKHRYRHILTNVLGGRSCRVETELQHFKLADRDRMLVCSDGLSDMVEDTAIERVLRRIETPGEACRELVDLALEAGGKDNITVIVARYSLAATPEIATPK